VIYLFAFFNTQELLAALILRNNGLNLTN